MFYYLQHTPTPSLEGSLQFLKLIPFLGGVEMSIFKTLYSTILWDLFPLALLDRDKVEMLAIIIHHFYHQYHYTQIFNESFAGTHHKIEFYFLFGNSFWSENSNGLYFQKSTVALNYELF